MRYTVGTISRLVGLTPQTIREYEGMGLLISQKGENNYRYFDADAVNKTAAIRRMRNMGFSLSDITRIYSDISHQSYLSLIDEALEKQSQTLFYQQLVLELMQGHAETLRTLDDTLNKCEIVSHPAFYCLDYRNNQELMINSKKDCDLLNSWMKHSLFTRNYSPFPIELLYGEEADHTIGFSIQAKYTQALDLDTCPPVFLRPASPCVHTLVWHTHELKLLPDGPGFILDFLKQNGLAITGQPFLVGETSFHQHKTKMFYGHLYLPIKD